MKLHKAIQQQYYFEFVLGELDDVPLRGFLGYYDEASGKSFLFTHQTFNILYFTYPNTLKHTKAIPGEGALVYANVTSSPSRAIELNVELVGKPVEFTYGVAWHETTTDPKKRAYISDGFFAWSQTGGKVHWLSIFNSLLLVLLLAGFLALVLLRILRKDIARYEAALSKSAEEDPLDAELEYGWKLIHGDVFRFPMGTRAVFCAFLGVGSQFLAMSFGILILGLIGLYYPGNEGVLEVSGLYVEIFPVFLPSNSKFSPSLMLTFCSSTLPLSICFSMSQRALCPDCDNRW